MAGLERTILEGLQSVMQAQDTRADNLANVDTPGFRRRVTRCFADAVGDRRGPVSALALDNSPGVLEETGNPLDLALEGNDCFLVSSASGPALCRGGSFHRAPDGRLVGPGGCALVGRAGDVRIAEGRVEISQDGAVLVGGREVDRLRRLQVTPGELTPLGSGLLAVATGADVTPSEGRVFTGVLESSNVEPVVEMVGMMDNLRRMEMLMQTLRAGDEIAQRAVTDVGSTRN